MGIQSNSKHILEMSRPHLEQNRPAPQTEQNNKGQQGESSARVNTDSRHNRKLMFATWPNLEQGRRMTEATYYRARERGNHHKHWDQPYTAPHM